MISVDYQGVVWLLLIVLSLVSAAYVYGHARGVRTFMKAIVALVGKRGSAEFIEEFDRIAGEDIEEQEMPRCFEGRMR